MKLQGHSQEQMRMVVFTRYSFIIAVLCAVVVIGGAGRCMAEGNGISAAYDRQLLMKRASSVGEVGAAFLKMTNNYPDFNLIVEASKEYKRTPTLERADYKAKEVQRLQNAFVGFSPGKTPLIVRAGVKLKLSSRPDGTATLEFYAPAKGQLYFPFLFDKYPIALIINDIELFQTIELNRTEQKIVRSNLPNAMSATLLLELIPVAADDKNPIVLDETSQYPMLSEISYIALLNSRGEQIWGLASSKHGAYAAIPDLVAKPMLDGAPVK